LTSTIWFDSTLPILTGKIMPGGLWGDVEEVWLWLAVAYCAWYRLVQQPIGQDRLEYGKLAFCPAGIDFLSG
jgi:hypothetical protein